MTRMFMMLMLAGLSLVSTAAVGSANDKSISICGTTWGKYGGEDLPGKGLVPDLVAKVFEHAGYEVEAIIVPWPKCVQRAKDQVYDLIAAGWQGENFAPHFDYLNVVLVDTINFVTLADSPLTSGEVEAVFGKRVGYVREAGGLDVLEQYEQIKISKVAVIKKLFPMLARGRVDAILSDPVNVREEVKVLDPPFEHELKILQPPLQTNFNSPLISKNHPDKEEMIADFDRSYRILLDQGGFYEDLMRIHDLEVQYLP